MSLERALSDAENVGSLPSDDLADEQATVARLADDLLDLHSAPDERHDVGVGLLTSKIAFVLEHLEGMRQCLGGRLTGSATTIARHDLDLPVIAEPSLDGRSLAIG